MKKLKDEGENCWHFEETVEGERGSIGPKEGHNVSVACPVTLHPFSGSVDPLSCSEDCYLLWESCYWRMSFLSSNKMVKLLSCWVHWYQTINCPALRGRIDLENMILNKNFPHFSPLCIHMAVHRDQLSAIFSRIHLHAESLLNNLGVCYHFCQA